jgi:hypothetical protein
MRTLSRGDVGLTDVAACIEDVQREPWFPLPTLSDVREATASIPSGEVRAIAGLLRDFSPKLRGVPIAVVVASNVSYGLVRMLGLLVDDVLTIRPFRDDASALEWLRAADGPRAESFS